MSFIYNNLWLAILITAVQSVYIRYNQAEQFEFVICTLRNVHNNGNQIKLNFIPIYATQLTNRRKIVLYSKEKSGYDIISKVSKILDTR